VLTDEDEYFEWLGPKSGQSGHLLQAASAAEQDGWVVDFRRRGWTDKEQDAAAEAQAQTQAQARAQRQAQAQAQARLRAAGQLRHPVRWGVSAPGDSFQDWSCCGCRNERSTHCKKS
jgi:hypothetical protein